MRAFPWPLIPAAAHTVAEQTHPVSLGNGCLCTVPSYAEVSQGRHTLEEGPLFSFRLLC